MFGFPETQHAFHPRRPVSTHFGGKPWTDGTLPISMNGLPDLQYDLAGLVWCARKHALRLARLRKRQD